MLTLCIRNGAISGMPLPGGPEAAWLSTTSVSRPATCSSFSQIHGLWVLPQPVLELVISLRLTKCEMELWGGLQDFENSEAVATFREAPEFHADVIQPARNPKP